MPSALFVTTVPITLEAFLLPFADRFRELGWRVDALANGATRHPRLDGHFDERFDVAWSRNPIAPSNLLGTARQVREIVAAGGYDIVHVHTPVAAFVTRYALRSLRGRAGAPVVIYTAHGFHFYEGGAAAANLLYRRLEHTATRWTDFLVTINQEDLEAARSLGGIAADRVRHIPGIGVDTDRFSPDAATSEEAAAVRHELGIPDSAFMLTMVAEFAPVKRHEHVLRALAEVKNDAVVLVLVGDGPLESRLREKVATLGLTERVRWAGYRRDLPAVLAASEAVVLASEREGLNRSVLEAMAAGRPVIGTQTRGIAEAVGSDAGWIVPKGDVEALAHAMETAAADPEDRERRGAAARRRAVREYALPRIIEAYEELYREALASRV
jgi:glycosyltransferase involved in cell wall biosynthesis